MHRIRLEGRGDLSEWRNAARPLLAAGVLPGDIEWLEAAGGDTDLFGAGEQPVAPALANLDRKTLNVPPAFLSLADAVVCHSDPFRFALLYRLLFRLMAERQLLDVRTDADVVRAHAMEKAVRRDSHKMTAFVRFKEIAMPPGSTTGRRRFVAWFEPDHHIVARTAPFFQRRFTDMDWIIATPRGSARWDGETLILSHEPLENPHLRDEADDLWRTYFANIFNPARLKVKMMQTEMPKKYWKNLPEAELIPGMIAAAEASVAAMAARAASQPPLFHHRIQQAASQVEATPAATAGSWQELRDEARQCTRCALHCTATQTVFGEGPADAPLMFVGEQPGDQEDLAGRPFVGPAGKVFDTVLEEVGLDRSTTYVTNAVKHFKYEPRGKRRIHQKPNMGEVTHCRWWLTRELDFVKPKLVVAMGATALFALTDNRGPLSAVRGQAMPIAEGQTLFATIHPSYLLRIPDEGRKREEMQKFREDMASINRLAQEMPLQP